MKNHNHKHGLFIVSINMLIISFLGSNYTWAEIEPNAQAVKFYPQVITLNAENFHKIPQFPIVFDGKTYQYDEYMKYFEDGLEITLYLTEKTNETGETVLYAFIADKEVDNLNFEKLSQELMLMEPYFAGNKGDIITFDSKLARKAGFAEESIQLAKEMTALTNNIVKEVNNALTSTHTRSSVKLEALDINTDNYLVLPQYFTAARTQYFSKRNTRRSRAGCRYLTSAACDCGHWFYPRPNRAQNWVKHSKVNDPAQKLRSWGYHETPGWAGGGWTRSQTYYPSQCGQNTFRDHAYIFNKQIREQNYEGWTPRGEPNPEFWTASKWPYPAWPTYVYWWHQKY